MKKLFLGLGAAALIMSSVSCGSGAKTESSASNDSSVVDNDSLIVALGAGMGSGFVVQYNSIPDTLPIKAKISKDEIIKGIEYILTIDTANMGMQAGISMGMQLAGQIAQLEQLGAKIDRKKVLDELKKAIMQDSTSMEEIQKYNTFMQMAQGKLQMAKLEQAPEAIQGKKAGEAFINKKKQEDPAIKTTASGLSYKIINEGTGAKPTDTQYVKVKYTGKLINDTVFDDSKGEAREFPVAGVVPGFSEGLKLLGVGGKAILYIPGKLGYGPQGQPQAGIGPNQTLVFEVELVEVKEQPQQPQGLPGNVVKGQSAQKPQVKPATK